jgi:hypothetical protein
VKRPSFSQALFFQAAALTCAALAGFIGGVDEAPYILGVAACLAALGLWLRHARGL